MESLNTKRRNNTCLLYTSRTLFAECLHRIEHAIPVYLACQHPEISFSTMPLPFESREEVLAWICKNQLGRRNLTPEQKKFLMGKQYSSESAPKHFAAISILQRNLAVFNLNTTRSPWKPVSALHRKITAAQVSFVENTTSVHTEYLFYDPFFKYYIQ